MSEYPKPTISEAIAKLQHYDEFKAVVQFLRDERDRFFGDLRQARDSSDVMKIAGSVATLDELIQVFTTD